MRDLIRTLSVTAEQGEDYEKKCIGCGEYFPSDAIAHFVAPTAIVETKNIGDKTTIWHFTHVCKGAKIGKNCTIGEGVYIGPNVVIGDNCKIQNHAQIFEGVTIGNNVFIGPCVCFTNDKVPYATKKDFKPQKTVVHDGVSIGANCTIICGITLYMASFVGAASIITKNVSAGDAVYGKH